MTEIPFVKDFDFEYGAPSQLSPLVRRVIANNPGPFTYTGSGTYIVGSGDAAIIDPGPDDSNHIEALLYTLKGERISHILITHTHTDHCGGAKRLAGRTGAQTFGFGPHPKTRSSLAASSLEEGGDDTFNPDVTIRDGDVITGAGWTLQALHTPGHLSNHLCFALEDENALFTGDHIMGWATSVIIPPAGNMGDYLESLEKLLSRNDAIYYPTHGAPIDKPQRYVRAVRAHRYIRDGQIIEQVKKGHTRIKEIVPIMYASVDERLHRAAAMNVLAHFIRLVRIGTMGCDGEPKIDSTFYIKNG